MTEWTTIRVRQTAKDKADEKKPDGVTWSEWVAEDRDVEIDVSAEVDYAEIETRLERVLERQIQ